MDTEKIGHRVKGKDYSGRPWDEIRRRYETGQAGPKALSEIYGIPVVTIKTKASRNRWIRNTYVKIMQHNATNMQHNATNMQHNATNMQHNATNDLVDATSKTIVVPQSRQGAALWGDQRIDRLLEDLGSWVDSWEGADTGVTLQHFCKSEHNTLNAKATQITYLYDNERFREGMERLRPLVADRIATLTWTLKSGKSAPLGIFWLKQFGWTDRQEIKVEHSGQSLESAISRAYDVTPKKLD